MRYVYCAFIDAMTQVIQLFLPDGWIDESSNVSAHRPPTVMPKARAQTPQLAIESSGLVSLR